MKFVICLLVFLPFFSWSDCKLTPEIIEANLKLDFEAFDQNITGGWRELSNRGCDLEAAMLIDIYRSHQGKPYTNDNLLVWHSGQLYAFANMPAIALQRFKRCFTPTEVDWLKWNAYVRGTIAFFEQDMKALITARDEAATVKNQWNDRNVAILNNLIKCFKKPYKDA